jgi:hypothetical protein
MVFAAALAVYGWTAAPALAWLDAAEFTAAAHGLGVAHPPGHPIPSLLGRAFLYLPLGDAALRVSLASALAGALAALGLYRAARALGVRRLLAVAAALGFAFTRAAWEQAARPEVYALEAALVVAALSWTLAWLVSADARALYAAVLATGLALANHHFVALLFFVPAAAVVLARRPGVAAAGRAAALGVLGLGAYLYLPLRAAHDALGWGDPDRWAPFAWTVSARAFQKSVGRTDFALGDVAVAVTDNLSLPLALLALLGAYALLRRRPAAGALLVGVAAAGLLGRAVLGFDADNPDALGYLLPAIAALFLLGAAALTAVVELVPRAAVPATLLALALPPAQLVRFADAASLRGARGSEPYGEAALAAVPAGALVVTSYFETYFTLVALQRTAGARPDVTVVDRNLQTHPFAPAAAARLHPGVDLDAALAPQGAPSMRPASRATTDLAGRAGRPVFVELAANLAADRRFVPDALLAEVRAVPPSDAERDAAEARDAADSAALAARLRATPARTDRHGADRVLAWNAYLRASFYCALGRGAAARAAAVPVAGDPMLAPLADCLAARP